MKRYSCCWYFTLSQLIYWHGMPVNTGMGCHSISRFSYWNMYETLTTGQRILTKEKCNAIPDWDNYANLALHPSRVTKSRTGFGLLWYKRECHFCRMAGNTVWSVWHVQLIVTNCYRNTPYLYRQWRFTNYYWPCTCRLGSSGRVRVELHAWDKQTDRQTDRS